MHADYDRLCWLRRWHCHSAPSPGRLALDRNGAAYHQVDDGIDLVAAELKKLSDAGVTVLWRPLHEASGNNGDGWFWWGRARSDGASQAQAYVQLWRHMYDRLANLHGLHNLIVITLERLPKF